MVEQKSEIEIPYTLSDLLYLMGRLRKPDTGCPWDLKQNWQSINTSTIEEAYEVVEAIESGDANKIKEELGDLLFQVVFYCQFAKEESAFNFDDVVEGITRKLVSRHPHVFPDGELQSERDVNLKIDEAVINKSWEVIKEGERAQRGQAGVLDDVATNLPALMRAEKLQKRASRVGLDWQSADQIIEKLREETSELDEAFKNAGNIEAQAEELGDLLFTCVNLARFVKLDSEKVLRSANIKFERRVSWIEKQLSSLGVSFESCDPEELDRYWKQAKESGI